MEFSEKVVSELEKRGWSRSEAARRGGISPSTFDKIINGFSEPGIRFLKGIAQAFDVPLIEVIFWLDPSASGELSPKKRELIQKAELADDASVEIALAALREAVKQKQQK